MAYEKVNSLDADRTITIGGYNKKTKQENPTSAEGYYLGSRITTGGKYGPSELHIIQDKDGNLGIWGKTNLTKQIKQVTPGCMIRITYKGMKNTTNGEMHMYEVEQDKKNFIDVSNLAEASEVDDEGGDVNEDTEGLDNEETDDNDNEPVTLPKGNTTTAAERQAKVAALLGRKGTKVS